MVLLLSKLVPALSVACMLASISRADQRPSVLRIGEVEASPRTIGPFQSISVQTFYDFFSSRFTIWRFIFINVSQYIFITIGWIISAAMWSLIKGEDLSKISIDVPIILDFLVNPQSGLANIGIGVGSAIFAVGGWSLLASLSGKSARRSLYNEGVSTSGNERLGNPELLTQDIYAPFDATFGWQGIAKQTAINTVLVTSFVSFWLFCSWLPVSASGRALKEARSEWDLWQDDRWRGQEDKLRDHQYVIDRITNAQGIFV